MNPADRIREAAEVDGRSLRLDYSGRGMFGAKCLAIDCDDPMDCIAEVGIPGAKTDQMGRGSVVYWPAVQADEE